MMTFANSMHLFLNNYSRQDRKFPRHKIIIAPGDNYVYITDNDKKVSFKSKELPFYDTNIFGDEYFCSINLYNFKEWYQESKNSKTDWKEWNERGIAYAKEIREQLPLAFDIWYQYQHTDDNKLVRLPPAYEV